jgi:CheY-like chemotaxis protein
VLLDIGMPEMDGLEVARRARQLPEHRDLTLIALSGWGQDEDRRRSREAGIDYHLVKPVDVDELGDLLTAVAPARSNHVRRR